MTGFNYIIDLTVLNGGAFGKLASMAGGFENSLDRVQSEVGQTDKKLNNMGRTGRAAFDGMRSSIMGWVTSLGIGLATMASLQTAAQNEGLNASIDFAGGAEGAKNLAYVRSEVDRLGLPLKESLNGFKTLSASMMGTGIQAEEQRKIFQGLGEGIATFHLPAEQANRAMLALGQMASKGTISAEELKGQLGEALPGAFGVAARAMGVTQVALNKMLEDGDVLASDFLPKFAAEMHKTFGKSAIDAANSATANFNRMQNSVYDLKVMVGEQLLPTAVSLIQNFLIPAVGWIGRNIEVLGFLATTIGGVWAATKIYNITAGIAALMTGGLTGAVNALSVAFYANPIGFIIGAIIAVGAAVIYAWNKFEGFRGFLFSTWSVMKEMANIVYDYLIAPLMAFGKTLLGTMTFNPDMIVQGFQEGVAAMQKIIDGPSIGDRLSNAMNTGWNEGIANFKGDKAGDSLTKAANPTGALGGTTFATPGAGTGAGTDKGNSKASELSNSITSGGQRNVTINVGKLNEGGITIHTTNLKEGATEVEAMLMKLMLQVVNSGNQQQGK